MCDHSVLTIRPNCPVFVACAASRTWHSVQSMYPPPRSARSETQGPATTAKTTASTYVTNFRFRLRVGEHDRRRQLGAQPLGLTARRRVREPELVEIHTTSASSSPWTNATTTTAGPQRQPYRPGSAACQPVTDHEISPATTHRQRRAPSAELCRWNSCHRVSNERDQRGDDRQGQQYRDGRRDDAERCRGDPWQVRLADRFVE